MKEITFQKQNHKKWQEFEQLLEESPKQHPDVLADLFVRITDDLSWARTFYPGSATENYLNELAARVHQEIYRNKKESRSRLITFWTDEFPLTMRKLQTPLFIALLIFGLAVWLGVISAQNDEGFVRIILGDSYVDMTLDNISKGDPLGVYKQENQFSMFFGIALNNALVALVCIMLGLMHWMGVGFMLFRNGIMLGSFMYFLAEQGHLKDAFLTVWVHGVIEIWCIIVAGAAGVAFGDAFWFPGAWPRMTALMRGARHALKVGFGLIPFFFLAAFFEGFITRYTQMSDVARMIIIFGSLAFVLWYFVFYPMILSVRKKQEIEGESKWRSFVLFILTFPVSGILLLLMNRKAQRLSLEKNTARTFYNRINPKSVFMIFTGALFIVLPAVALFMQIVSEVYAEASAFILFGFLMVTGVGLIILGIAMHNRIEEDLIIERKNKTTESSYERKASTIKV